MLWVPVCNSFLLSELGLTSRQLPERLEESGVSNGAHSVIFSTSIKLNKLFYCAEPPPMLTVTLPDRNWLLLREKADSHPYCRFTRHILYMQFITCFNISKTIFYNLIWDYFEIYRAQWNSCNNYVKKR